MKIAHLLEAKLIKDKRYSWTQEQNDELAARYPNELTRVIADSMGLGLSAVSQHAQAMGLRKSEEFLIAAKLKKDPSAPKRPKRILLVDQFKAGTRFDSIVVLSRLIISERNNYWICVCDCGAFCKVHTDILKGGTTKSCGCSGYEHHGMSKSSEYRIWAGILQRCNIKTNCNWRNYGGRGITVCDEWASFQNFYRDMGPRPSPKHSVERKNNSLGYSRSNCFWATPTEQHNNKRTNVRLVVNGESKTLAEWSRATNISISVLALRKKRGYSDYECVMTPVVVGGRGGIRISEQAEAEQ